MVSVNHTALLNVCKSISGFVQTNSSICVFEMENFEDYFPKVKESTGGKDLVSLYKVSDDRQLISVLSRTTGAVYHQANKYKNDIEVLTNPTEKILKIFEDKQKRKFEDFAQKYSEKVVCVVTVTNKSTQLS